MVGRLGAGFGRLGAKRRSGLPFPVYKAGGTVGAATTGTTVAAPLATNVVNDILIIQAFCRGSNTAFSAIAGWTEITQFDVSTSRVGFWWKRSGGSESAPTVTNTGRTSTNLLSAQMSSWSGCKTAGTPYEALLNASSASGALSGVSVITTGARRLALSLWTKGANTATAPNGAWVERLDQGTGGGGACRFMIDSASAEGAGTVTACSRASSAELYGMIGIALIP